MQFLIVPTRQCGVASSGAPRHLRTTAVMKSLAIAIVAACALPVQAHTAFEDLMLGNVEAGLSTKVGFYSGERLYLAANGDSTLFVAYVSGVIDAAPLMPVFNRARFCVPRGATSGQAAAVVLKYLEANPATLHLSAAYLVRLSLHDAWPCPIEAPPAPEAPETPEAS